MSTDIFKILCQILYFRDGLGGGGLRCGMEMGCLISSVEGRGAGVAGREEVELRCGAGLAVRDGDGLSD